jgi:hypothetical protein
MSDVQSISIQHRFTENDTECLLSSDLNKLRRSRRGTCQFEIQSILVVNQTYRPTPDCSVRKVFDLKSNISTTLQQINGHTFPNDQKLLTFYPKLQWANERFIYTPPTRVFFPWKNFEDAKFVLEENSLTKINDFEDYTLDVEILLLVHRQPWTGPICGIC